MLQREIKYSPVEIKTLQYKLTDITVKIAPTNGEHLNLYGTSYTAKLEGKNTPDSAALARGIAPNIVHSIDAALLRSAVLKVNGDVSCIHDDLGVQTCDVKKALQAVRTAYVEVIKTKPLEQVYKGLGLLDEYEEEDNGLDLNDVLESAYLFS